MNSLPGSRCATAYEPTAASTSPICTADGYTKGLERFLRALTHIDPSRLAANFGGRMSSVRGAHAEYPVLSAVRDRVAPGTCVAYPLSLRAQCVHYARAELKHLASARERVLGRWGIGVADALLAAAAVERCTQWNAWLLSTNPLSATIADDVDAVTAALVRAYRGDAVWLRNVDAAVDARLLPRLRAAGYITIASRRVYHFDGESAGFTRRSSTRRDARLLDDGRFEVVPHEGFSARDLERVPALYRAVYVAKHSRYNPDYGPAFFDRAWRERWLTFTGLRDPGGSLVAVMGLLRVGRRTSTPFVGYDTSAPERDALYRRLVALLLAQTARDRDRLNFSSGAADFKRRRGGVASTEYNALYVEHLPSHRRAAWHALSALSGRIAEAALVRAQP